MTTTQKYSSTSNRISISKLYDSARESCNELDVADFKDTVENLANHYEELNSHKDFLVALAKRSALASLFNDNKRIRSGYKDILKMNKMLENDKDFRANFAIGMSLMELANEYNENCSSILSLIEDINLPESLKNKTKAAYNHFVKKTR
ncbi:MAG: hypothetical protein ACP5OG_02945 [Candidatus Nanoarchaeia archaeon]